jgi:hypothetical protein
MSLNDTLRQKVDRIVLLDPESSSLRSMLEMLADRDEHSTYPPAIHQATRYYQASRKRVHWASQRFMNVVIGDPDTKQAWARLQVYLPGREAEDWPNIVVRLRDAPALFTVIKDAYGQLWRLGSTKAPSVPTLDVSVRECGWDLDKSRDRSGEGAVMTVKVLFQPKSPPIQLASVGLVFEGREHEALAMPTKLIERDHAETYDFFVPGAPVSQRLIHMGLDQGDGEGVGVQPRTLSEDEWPRARLHVVAGSFDFKTGEFLAPTPTRPLAARMYGSRR